MRSKIQKTQNSARVDPVSSPRPSTPQFSHPVLQLQQQIGNQAVQRLLQSGRIQAKLTICEPNDKYEQEADRVADQVMRMSEPTTIEQSHNNLSIQTPVIQRVCPQCEKELKRQPTEDIEEEEEELLQAKEMPGQSPEVSNELEGSINSLRGGGQPLSSSVRNYMEPRFGHNFNQVRVHTDTQAANVARSINARAFTLGQDVVFGSGQYSPGTNEGRRLLAHELTHVAQQGSSVTGKDSVNPLIQRWEASEHVHIAEQVYKPKVMVGHFRRLLKKTGVNKLPLRFYKDGITYAQAVAMADFFESFEQLYNAPEHHVKAILSGIKKEAPILIDKRKGKSVKDKISGKDAKKLSDLDMYFTKTSGGIYLYAAKTNYSHFTYTHYKSQENNISAWKRIHADAAAKAKKAKKEKNQIKLADAFMTNAFADHFLTDAFAVGHTTARSTTESGMIKKIKSMLGEVLTAVLVEKKIGWWLTSPFMLIPGSAHLLVILDIIIGRSLAGNTDIKSIPYKVIHDLDNKKGRKVTNKKGDKPWHAFGDKKLLSNENKANYAKVIKAVKKSKHEIFVAAKLNKDPANKPELMYPNKVVSERDWSELDAKKELHDLISSKFDMLELLWTEDNIIRAYLKRSKPSEIKFIAVMHKKYMINVLLKNFTGDDDEMAINSILDNSTAKDAIKIIEDIGLKTIGDDIHGAEYKDFIKKITKKYKKADYKTKWKYIQKLLDMTTGDYEEDAINEIFRSLNPKQAAKMIREIGFAKLEENLHGSEYKSFLMILVKKYQKLNAMHKITLISGLLDITTGNAEERTINDLLASSSPHDVTIIITTLGFTKMEDNINGDEYDQFIGVVRTKLSAANIADKVRFINHLLSNGTTEYEEELIILILKDSSNKDVLGLLKSIGVGNFISNLSGSETKQFQEIMKNSGMKY